MKHHRHIILNEHGYIDGYKGNREKFKLSLDKSTSIKEICPDFHLKNLKMAFILILISELLFDEKLNNKRKENAKSQEHLFSEKLVFQR